MQNFRNAVHRELQRAPRLAQALRVLLRHNPDLLPYTRVYLNSYRKEHSPLLDEIPLITLAATRFLDRFLRPTMRVFEFGSGGSTPYFARRCQQVIAVENYAPWLNQVSDTLQQKNLSNAQMILIEPEAESECQRLDGLPAWVKYQSNTVRTEFAGQTFSRYAQSIDQYPDAHFDVVLVDGRARQSCAYHAIKKVKSGGILIMDDTHRTEYNDAITYLSHQFRVQHFQSIRPYHAKMAYNTQTSVWHIERKE